MKITDLSPEDQALLQTTFPAEIVKEASDNQAKMDDLLDAGEKIASEMAEEMDKHEKDEKDGKDGKSEAAKKLSDEHKKEAQVRGAFIARSTFDSLVKQGSERHQDELHYLYPLLAEKLGMDAAKVKAMAAAAKAKGKDMLKNHGKHMGGAAAGGAAAGFAAGRASKK